MNDEGSALDPVRAIARELQLPLPLVAGRRERIAMITR